MALDAGTFIMTWPASATTEAGGAIAANVTPAGVKASYCAPQPTDVAVIPVRNSDSGAYAAEVARL